MMNRQEKTRPSTKFHLLFVLALVAYLAISFTSSFSKNRSNLSALKKIESLTEVDYSHLPIAIPDEDFKPLDTYSNSDLTSALQNELFKNHQWKRLINSKKMSVGIVDLNNPSQPRFASINGSEMMYAASLPKIAVLLAAEDALERGELIENTQIKNDMRLMISKSNNQATTRMIDLLGFQKIADVLTSKRYHFYQENHGGGLWVGKRYAASGPTNREPLKNLSHAATADQVCRFYYMMVNGKLVNEERSKHMLEMMGNPELHHKFVNTLERIAPGAQLFRKSGSWRNWHSDSILVWDSERKYILVALIENEGGEQIIRNLVTPIERAINAS